MAKFELDPKAGEAVRMEAFQHGTEGWLDYDPNTLTIQAHREGSKPVNKPISLTGKFFGTKQPQVPTCSEPSEGNAGCSKWYGCPMKKYPHSGPGVVIIRKKGTVGAVNCYDFFETTRGGRPTSQTHYGLDGWSLDTSRTTIDILGRSWAIKDGTINKKSTPEEIKNTRPRKEELEMGGLLAPWWSLMKKKGLELPEQAQYYPELVEDDEPAEEPSKSRKRRSSRSA